MYLTYKREPKPPVQQVSIHLGVVEATNLSEILKNWLGGNGSSWSATKRQFVHDLLNGLESSLKGIDASNVEEAK